MVVKSASKKKLMDVGFSEVMAHYLADDMKWNEWQELPLTGKNSGFKKQFYKRMKRGRKAVRNQQGDPLFKEIYAGTLIEPTPIL